MARESSSRFSDDEDDGPEVSVGELLAMLLRRWRLIASVFVVAALGGFGAATAIPNWYTARTLILPPQQQQSASAAALSQLGALAGLAGGIASVKSPADQYVALMQSVTVSDRIIDKFDLQAVYESKFRHDARSTLAGSVRIGVGKKDGLITVEVDDREPKRAAAMANAYVDALRQITNTLAVTEAQQRRVFFEQQLTQAKERLAGAQSALEDSGISQGALKVEPRAAAESYAQLRAQATAAEVRLQGMRQTLADSTPEVRQQLALLGALQAQVGRAERQYDGRGGSDYINKYREFKYRESLFDIFVRQYELAKVDESREGALIQVVDIAQTPERKAGPKRSLIALAVAMVSLVAVCLYVLIAGFLAERRKLQLRK